MPRGNDTQADRLRDFRRSRGLTQEGLAQRAGLSLGVIKKIERGGTARIETYHALARALKVRTSALFEPGSPHSTLRDDGDKMTLMLMRQAVAPPITVSGRPGLGDSIAVDPDLRHLRRTADALAKSYYRDDYGQVADLLPALVRSTGIALEYFDGGPEHTEALKLRADVLQMAGRYLTQVRAYDLAQLALRDAVQDAAAAADRTGAASAIYLQGWTLVRQGRLDEAEQLAVVTADEIEPRISRASQKELGVWGRLLIRASSAAARNNRAREAREVLRLARTAGAALGGSTATELCSWGRFNWSAVAFQAVENQLVAEKPDRVLGLAARIPKSATATSNTWNRHMLDVAQAHAMLRHSDEATGLLAGLHEQAPEWLRHQRLATETFQTVLRSNKRRLTRQQRDLARFFAIT
ncbi:helix-turn-helix domain-containing protein [Streptomyces sirii]|uniref:helix-turn-helix domain-containing protein n=1 Tax=Streptomyces sirii TaxID=3127701 RepID=UPI003D35F230